LGTLASFLRRKTDFFTGAKQAEWEKLLLDVFTKESKLAISDHNEKLKAREASQRLKDEKERAEREARKKEIDDNKICDIRILHFPQKQVLWSFSLFHWL